MLLFQPPSQSRQLLPTSQSTYYQSHPPSVSARHQPVRAAASVPTTGRFTSEYENISSLSPGPRTMNPDMNSVLQRIAPIFDTQCMVIMVCHQCHMLHQLNTKYDHMIPFKGRNKQQVFDTQFHTHLCIAE